MIRVALASRVALPQRLVIERGGLALRSIRRSSWRSWTRRVLRSTTSPSIPRTTSSSTTATGVAAAQEVLWGVGISIGVTYGGGTAAQRTIDLISAGCDFQP